MTTTLINRYNKADFEKIQMNGFVYTLSSDIIQIIQTIATQVGSPEYIKSPQFEKQEHVKNNVGAGAGAGYRIKRGKIQELTNNDWNAVKHFSTTLINKKEGIDASIDQIRKHLNKMTNKTYVSLKEKIIEEIKQITNNTNGEVTDDMNKIGEAIFNIASGNSFFSTMYAELFKELMEQFEFMRDIFLLNFDKFRSIFNTIEYCDPNKDYDKFCVNNKMNEQRRAISLFYVNLMLQDIIEPIKLITIINDLQNYMTTLVVEENNKSIVDELSEVLYILITNSYDMLKHEACWQEIVGRVKQFSELKPNVVPSISNKALFKHMDMLDVI
jgi:hypothetical protein